MTNSSEQICINWQVPPRRKGWRGVLEILAGPGATAAEMWLQFTFAFGMGLAMYLYIRLAELPWNGWQMAVAIYLMFDIGGGIATNATSSAKRWWHRPEKGTWQSYLRFNLAHFYMPLLITLAFFPSQWTFFFVTYGYLLFAGSCITAAPLYLRRPLAFILYVGALFISFLIVLPSGLAWFIPLFYLKLLLSHQLREEPYRPVGEAA